MIKNHGAILRSNIGALPVQCSRVMIRPEDVQKFVIADLRGIKLDFHHLGVSALVGANIVIRRILFCSSRIPDAGGYNTFHVAASFLYAPEPPRTQPTFFLLHTRTMQ